jgi:protein O-mannosyl-transferase
MARTKAVNAGRLTQRQVLLAVGIVALAGLLYLPTLRYDFVWDDKALIVDNGDLAVSTPLPFFGQSFTHWWAKQGLGPHSYYRPLVVTSFWLDRKLWGAKPVGFHLTNVLLNCAVGVLVVLVLAEMLASFWPALLGGLALALHPTHVESVAFVSDRTDLAMTLFVLLAFLALLRLRRRPSAGMLVLVVVSFAAALLCKEAAVMFPVLVLLLLLPMLRQRVWRRPVLVLAGLMVAVVVAYLAARAAVLTGSAPAWGAIGTGQRFMLAVNAFGRYAFMSVAPFDRRIQFSDPQALAAFGWPTIAAVVALAGLVWTAVRFRRRPAGTGSLWFLLFILPACNLVPPGPSYLSQRMLYLPSFGIVLAVAALGMTLRRGRRALAVLALLYVGVMGLGVVRSMPVWRNELSLHTTMVAQSPNDGQARLDLARVLQAGGDRQAAAREFRLAAGLLPGSAEAHAELGRILEDIGTLSGADSAFRRAVTLAPGDAGLWNSLGDVLLQAGDAGGAAGAYRRALGIDPNSAMVHNNLGVAMRQGGDVSGAESEYRQALGLQPDLALAHNNLGELHALRGSQDSALAEFRRALQSRPDYALARFNEGAALQALGRAEEARSAFERLLKQDPSFPGAAERLLALPRIGPR